MMLSSECPITKQVTYEELLNILPYNWKLQYLECVLNKQNREADNY